MTRNPEFAASIVAALITPLIPGAGPPPTNMATVFCHFTTLFRGFERSFHTKSYLALHFLIPIFPTLKTGRINGFTAFGAILAEAKLNRTRIIIFFYG